MPAAYTPLDPLQQQSMGNSAASSPVVGPGGTTGGVARGHIGAGFGPYAPVNKATADPRNQQRDSQFSTFSQDSGFSSQPHTPSTGNAKYQPSSSSNAHSTSLLLWDPKDKDADDWMHNPDPARDAKLDRSCDPFSVRGWLNMATIFILSAGLITLFGGYPIISHFNNQPAAASTKNLAANAEQAAKLKLPSMIDTATDSSVYSRTGYDGEQYSLVFSDEFNTDGRTFFPGDDPFWEAVDLHYWQTGDYQWYDPRAVTTTNGSMRITMRQIPSHGLNFESGMVQSWNKFCFTTGYIEVAVRLPGKGDIPGFWPGIWTLGNLGRAGYGASTEGLWPYSYDSCDVGTFPNQTYPGTETPTAAYTTGNEYDDYLLSYLPGQRLSACTCKGESHPGPSNSRGRASPEIDILEAQIDPIARTGSASQSVQIAPFNAGYIYDNKSTTIYDATITAYNTYFGGKYQQAVSAVTNIGTSNYALNDNTFGLYSFEYWSNRKNRGEGVITWGFENKATWQALAASFGPDPATDISERIVSEEPMSIIFNFGLSAGFQHVDFKQIQFPAILDIDYVRVYQRTGSINYGCNPPDYPTTDYINSHLKAYMNANLTSWAAAKYSWPKNSKLDSC